MPSPAQCYLRAWHGTSQHIPTLHLTVLGLPYTNKSWVGVNLGGGGGVGFFASPGAAFPRRYSLILAQRHCELSPLGCWGEVCWPAPLMPFL